MYKYTGVCVCVSVGVSSRVTAAIVVIRIVAGKGRDWSNSRLA